jgi:hypothetical protein
MIKIKRITLATFGSPNFDNQEFTTRRPLRRNRILKTT